MYVAIFNDKFIIIFLYINDSIVTIITVSIKLKTQLLEIVDKCGASDFNYVNTVEVFAYYLCMLNTNS